VDNLASRFPNTDPVLLEVDRRPDELDKLIQSHDIVIRSLFSTVVLRAAMKCIIIMLGFYPRDAVLARVFVGAVLWLPDVCYTCLHFFIFLLVFGYIQYQVLHHWFRLVMLRAMNV